MENHSVCTFGDYSLDTRNELLTRSGAPVSLPPKVFQALVILLEAYPAVVTKEDLRSALWPDTVVEEAALTQTIYTLRKLLGPGPEGADFVQTVPRRGYRFRGPLAPATLSAPSSARRRRIPVWAGIAAAAAVVTALALVPTRDPILKPADPVRLRRAVELTQEGRAIWKQRRSTGTPESYFRQALDLAPDYAPAQVALADALAFTDNRSQEADQIVARVLHQHDRMGEAHATAGFLAMTHHWDWNTAIRELDRAVELEPRYTTAFSWQALYYSLRGDSTRALNIVQSALDIEPANLNLLSDQCRALYFALRPEEALAVCNRVLAIDPQFASARNHLLSIYSYLGDIANAAPHFYRPTDARRFDPQVLQAGIPGLWSNLITAMKRESSAASYPFALAYAFQRDYDHAMTELESATRNHEFMVVFAAAEPAFIPMRKSSRFKSICTAMHLPSPD